MLEVHVQKAGSTLEPSLGSAFAIRLCGFLCVIRHFCKIISSAVRWSLSARIL
jgi:hypothetical protein